MKLTLRLLYFLGILALVFFIYVIISLYNGTITDYQPEEKITLDIEHNVSNNIHSDSTFSFVTWNLGYGGLGSKSDFFFNKGNMLFSGGSMVRSPEEYVEEYLDLQEQFFVKHPADFYLLQEVDVESKRSYYNNQLGRIHNILPNHEQTFALNYDVKRVPIPIMEPINVMGKVYGGLATFSRYTSQSATRYQLPGEYEWTTRIFQLDRCIALNRYSLESGKELVVMNVHNSAFDKGGYIKKQQLAYFKELAMGEYEKGNYVIAGGDWNQCPPGFPYDTFVTNGNSDRKLINIGKDFFPEDWTWAYDETIPSNRSSDEQYIPGQTFTSIIDFYLISPNVELRNVKTIDLKFRSSDHQPVFMEVDLKEGD